MRLRKALSELARAVADEAERNPNFGNRIAVALGLSPTTTVGAGVQTPGAIVRPRPRNRRSSPILDPIEVARQGEGTLREQLKPLSVEQLKDIVAAFGMDPGKLVMKWKTGDRIIDRIVEVSLSRAQKGNAFRAQSEPR